VITHWHYFTYLCQTNKQKRVVNLTLQLFQVIYNMKLLEIWIPQKSRFFPTLFHATKCYKMGIEKRNYRHNSTESKPLLHAYNIDNFKWAVCLAWTPEQTDKQNKQVGYYYCNTGGSYELFGLSILRLNSQSEISAKNRSKPKKYGHFASIVIEINRSKLIILHRNLDVNESQGEFQENKSKQIILHHRSLCKIDGKFKTDHFASQITVQNWW